MDDKHSGKTKMKSSKPLIHPLSTTSITAGNSQTDSKMKSNDTLLRKIPQQSAYLESLNIKKMKGFNKKSQGSLSGTVQTKNNEDAAKVNRYGASRPTPNLLARAQKLQSTINYYEPNKTFSMSGAMCNGNDKFPRLDSTSDLLSRTKSRSKPTQGSSCSKTSTSQKPIPGGYLRSSSFTKESAANLRSSKRAENDREKQSPSYSPNYKQILLPTITNQTSRPRSRQRNKDSLQQNQSQVPRPKPTHANKEGKVDADTTAPQAGLKPSSRQLNKEIKVSKESSNECALARALYSSEVNSSESNTTTAQSNARPRSRQVLRDSKQMSKNQKNKTSLNMTKQRLRPTTKEKNNTEGVQRPQELTTTGPPISRPQSQQFAKDEDNNELITSKTESELNLLEITDSIFSRPLSGPKDNADSSKKRVTFTRASPKVSRTLTKERGEGVPATATSTLPYMNKKCNVDSLSTSKKEPVKSPAASLVIEEVKQSQTLPVISSPKVDKTPTKVPATKSSSRTSARSSGRPGTGGSGRSSRPTSATSTRFLSGCGMNLAAILTQTLKLTSVNRRPRDGGDGPGNFKTDNVDNLPYLLPNPRLAPGPNGDAFNPPVNTPVSPKSPTSDSVQANETSSQEDCCQKPFDVDDDAEPYCSGGTTYDKECDSSGHDFVTDYLQLESMKEVNHISHAISRAKICRLVKGADSNLTLEQLKASRSHYLQLPCFADSKFFLRIHVPPHLFMQGKSLDRDLLTLQYLQSKMDTLYKKNLKSFDAQHYVGIRPATSSEESPSKQSNSSQTQQPSKYKNEEELDVPFSKEAYLQSFSKLFQSVQLPQWAKECFGSGSASEEEEEEGYMTTSTDEEILTKSPADNISERAAVAQKILQMFESGHLKKSHRTTGDATLDAKLKRLTDVDHSSKGFDEDASSDNPSEPP